MALLPIVSIVAFIAGLMLAVFSMLHGVGHIRRNSTTAPSPYINLPTLAAFAVGFGAVGYPLASHARLVPWAVVLIAIATGILCVVGTITLLARWALRGMPIAADDADEIQGQFALVTRDIPTGASGEISYERLGKKEVRTLARSLSERPLAAGTEVVIDRIENGVAFVEEWTVVEQRL